MTVASWRNLNVATMMQGGKDLNKARCAQSLLRKTSILIVLINSFSYDAEKLWKYVEIQIRLPGYHRLQLQDMVRQYIRYSDLTKSSTEDGVWSYRTFKGQTGNLVLKWLVLSFLWAMNQGWIKKKHVTGIFGPAIFSWSDTSHQFVHTHLHTCKIHF